jgi:hypothetical protein
MSKVGKPNVTGVNVTPFVNVPQIDSQTTLVKNTSAVTIGANVLGAATLTKGSGLYSYNSTTGVYTALKNIDVDLSLTMQASAASIVRPTIEVNGVEVAIDYTEASTNFAASCSFTGSVLSGQTFRFYSGGGTSNLNIAGVKATALSDQILTAPETFSTDTAALTYANAATYTLSTLANAPVGTYITFTYAANTNTRTQTTLTNRPTQTDADMNANGMLIYTRAFNAPSTAGNPAVFAIQIGKGLKGVSKNLYKSAGKVTAGNLDSVVYSSAGESGLEQQDYNEVTGVLFMDAGVKFLGTNTNHTFQFIDITTQTSGYLVINAAKNPALTGLGLNRIAARGVNSSGTTFGNAFTALTYNAAKTFDTNGALNAATGVFTAPETGFYELKGNVNFNSALYAVNSIVVMAAYKNGAVYGYMGQISANTAGTYVLGLTGSTMIFLGKGETVEIRILNERGSTAIAASTTVNSGSFIKVSV